MNFIIENEKYGKIENGKINHPVKIETYREGEERFFQDFEENRKRFLEYLESEKAARECEYEKNILFEIPVNEFGKQDTSLERSVDYPEKFALEILDTQKIISLYKRIEKNHPELFSRNKTLDGDSETTIRKKAKKIKWDDKNGVVTFGLKKHTFREPVKDYLFVLFDILWKNRKIVSKKDERKGTKKSHSDIAFAISERTSFDVPNIMKSLPTSIDTIRRELLRKNFPIKMINDEEHTQLIDFSR